MSPLSRLVLPLASQYSTSASRVVEVKDIDYELVATPTLIQLHLRDHGKPADVSRASDKLTLLTGTEKPQVELKPVGDGSVPLRGQAFALGRSLTSFHQR